MNSPARATAARLIAAADLFLAHGRLCAAADAIEEADQLLLSPAEEGRLGDVAARLLERMDATLVASEPLPVNVLTFERRREVAQ